MKYSNSRTFKNIRGSVRTLPGHDKVHVYCVGKAHLQYFEGYDDSDDFEFLCTRCFRLDDNSSMDSESD